jgi:hypothetical protein
MERSCLRPFDAEEMIPLALLIVRVFLCPTIPARLYWR